MTNRTRKTTSPTPTVAPRARRLAVIGAGIAGIACARTLVQAGHEVKLFECNAQAGGRMATDDTVYGSFDYGAQYFTVRDERFAQTLALTPKLCKPWSATTVRVLDTYGRVAAASLPYTEPHWVPTPGMSALPRYWAEPLVARQAIEFDTKVTAIGRDALQPDQWQLATLGATGASDAQRVFGGFDGVVLAVPHAQAVQLLRASSLGAAFQQKLDRVSVGPCWTLMVAFPQAMQAGLAHLGPQWNAARSTHHRIAWLARESSKPGRGHIERWTVQASTAWSAEHLHDDTPRVVAKLSKAFSEVTGIRAAPTHASAYAWHQAQTLEPLGESHLWDPRLRVGVCGDWCLGHRVENAFVSGLELALAMA
jgi:renalase